jgi:methionine-rich copper-binding protein CopC
LTSPRVRWSDRPIARWWVIAAAAAAALVLPSQAAGHATLLSTTPGDEAVVETAPRDIVLRFSEPVVVGPGDVKVFDGVAEPVAIGAVRQPQPREVVVEVAGELERGSYTVVWRVISRDLDPANDFFVFHVGAGRRPAEGGAAATAPADDGTPTAALAVPAVVLLGAAGAGIAVRRRPRLRLVPVAAGAAAAVALAVIAAGNGGSAGSAARAEPFRTDLRMGALAATVSVAPAQLGANRIELALPQPTGTEGGYFEVRVVASLPSAGLGPLRFTGIQGTDLGRFAVRRAYLPLPGEWQLRVSARRGLKGRYAGTVTLPIRQQAVAAS